MTGPVRPSGSPSLPAGGNPPAKPPGSEVATTEVTSALLNDPKKTPATSLSERTVRTSPTTPQVNSRARTEKLKKDYLQQHSRVGALEAQEHLLNNLELLQHYLENPSDTPHNPPFLVIHAGVKGHMASVIPTDRSPGHDEKQAVTVREELKSLVMAIKDYNDSAKRTELSTSLSESRILLSGYKQALKEAGEPIPDVSRDQQGISLDVDSLASTASSQPSAEYAPPKPPSTAPLQPGKKPTTPNTDRPEKSDADTQSSASGSLEERDGKQRVEVPSPPATPSLGGKSGFVFYKNEADSSADIIPGTGLQLLDAEQFDRDTKRPASSKASSQADSGISLSVSDDETLSDTTSLRDSESSDTDTSKPSLTPEASQEEIRGELFEQDGPSDVNLETAKDFLTRTGAARQENEVARHPYLASLNAEEIFKDNQRPIMSKRGSRKQFAEPQPLSSCAPGVKYDRQGRSHRARKALLFQVLVNLHKKHSDKRQEVGLIPPETLLAFQLGIMTSRPNTNAVLHQAGSTIDRDDCFNNLVNEDKVNANVARVVAETVTGTERRRDNLTSVIMRDVETLEMMRFKDSFEIDKLESWGRFKDRQAAKNDLKQLCIEWRTLLNKQGELGFDIGLDTADIPQSTLTIGSKVIDGSDTLPLIADLDLRKVMDVSNPYLAQEGSLRESPFLKGLYDFEES